MCTFGDMLANRQTDRHTDMVITILRFLYRGRSNNKRQWIHDSTTAPCWVTVIVSSFVVVDCSVATPGKTEGGTGVVAGSVTAEESSTGPTEDTSSVRPAISYAWVVTNTLARLVTIEDTTGVNRQHRLSSSSGRNCTHGNKLSGCCAPKNSPKSIFAIPYRTLFNNSK